jgi:outer membrane protein OmpA-like peptidoglycan-associated protein
MKKFNLILFFLATLAVTLLAGMAPQAAIAANSGGEKKSATMPVRDDPARVLQKRVKDQIANGISIDSYAIALAQAWLDYGRESHFRKDRRAAGEAFGEAQRVIEVLERDGVNAKVEARLIPASRQLRDDLWRKAAALKGEAEFNCATWQTARMEVALVAAGRADNDMGWRAARPFVKRAERLAREADSKIKECAEPKPVIKPEQPAVDKKTDDKIIAAPPADGKTADLAPAQSMPDRVHFPREGAELSDVSALVLEQVSYVMRANPAAVLELRGYADELASTEDNEKLALARAQAVKDYLIETGVGGERLIAKTEALAATEGLNNLERAKRRRVEFVLPNGDEIPLEYQDKDLTTEGPSGPQN